MKSKRFDGPGDAVKLRAMKRDRFTCVYCGVSGSEAELEIDHIVPVSKGGSHHIANLTTACRSCNQKKSDGTLKRSRTERTPTGGVVGLYVVTLKEQPGDFGRVQYQGRITADEGEVALVQRYSFLDGRATDVVPIPRADLLNTDKCRLFAEWREWRRFMFEDAEEARRKRGDPVGWHGGDFEEVLALEMAT